MFWRFENTGSKSGAFNMMYDEELAQALLNGTGSPTVRVYGWRPPALSLGYHQSSDEIDVDKCRRAGVDVVRRPTGGRAILHWNEATYCVVMRGSRAGVLSIYNQISQALVGGLLRLGVHASLEKCQPHFPSLYKSPSSTACFTSAARYEIRVGGRKLVGSAQRRFARETGEEVILQHGSILLGAEHKQIVEFLNLRDERAREQIASDLEQNTIDLAAALGRNVEFEEVAECIRQGFESAWGIRFSSADVEEPTLTM